MQQNFLFSIELRNAKRGLEISGAEWSKKERTMNSKKMSKRRGKWKLKRGKEKRRNEVLTNQYAPYNKLRAQ